ncbi:MAG: hypothetical protein HC767_04190 [Akkermansiaceae bacterium]|nr:hypothetical protein [Akkermansiaceae bacterium]
MIKLCLFYVLDAGCDMGMLSALVQAVGQAEKAQVTVVKTASELLAAISGGSKHVEIQDHLDLTSLPLLNSMLLGKVPSSVKSIRVRRTSRLSWLLRRSTKDCIVSRLLQVYVILRIADALHQRNG